MQYFFIGSPKKLKSNKYLLTLCICSLFRFIFYCLIYNHCLFYVAHIISPYSFVDKNMFSKIILIFNIV